MHVWSKVCIHDCGRLSHEKCTHLNVSRLTHSSFLSTFWVAFVSTKTRIPFLVNSSKRKLQLLIDCCASVPLIRVAAPNIINSVRANRVMIYDRGLSEINSQKKNFFSNQLDDHDSLESFFYRASLVAPIVLRGRRAHTIRVYTYFITHAKFRFLWLHVHQTESMQI